MTKLDETKPSVSYTFRKTNDGEREGFAQRDGFTAEGNLGGIVDNRHAIPNEELLRRLGGSIGNEYLRKVLEDIYPHQNVDQDTGFGTDEKKAYEETIGKLKRKHISNITPHLEQLLSLINKFVKTSKTFRDALLADNIVEVLATKVKDHVNRPLTADGWKVLKLTYKVSLELVSNDIDSNMFTAHMLATGFANASVDLLNNPSVFTVHDKTPLYSETVLYALEFLVNITRRAPILQKVQSLGNALLKYSSSGDAKVAKVAQLLKTLVSLSGDGKSQVNINVPLPGQLLTSEQQQDRDIAIAAFLAGNLELMAANKYFCDIVKTDRHPNEWNGIVFTINAIENFAVDNIVFANELFAKGIIPTIYKILSMEKLYTMSSENQNLAWLTDKLLDLLIEICQRKVVWRYLTQHDLFSMYWRILHSGSSEIVAAKALVLIAFYSLNVNKDIANAGITFKASEENVTAVNKGISRLRLNRYEIMPVLGQFLVDSGFIQNASEEAVKVSGDNPEKSISTLSTTCRRRLWNLIEAIGRTAMANKAVVDTMMTNDKVINVLKVMARHAYGNVKKKDVEATDFVRDVLILLTAIAHHGYGKETIDDTTVDLLCTMVEEGHEIDVSVSRWAVTFLAINHALIKRDKPLIKLPTAINYSDPSNGAEFLILFSEKFKGIGWERAISSLADYLSGDHPLEFISRDVACMINAEPANLEVIIQETTMKRRLLSVLAQYAKHSANLSYEFFRSEILRLLLRLLSNESILERCKDLTSSIPVLLQDIVFCVSELFSLPSNMQYIDRIHRDGIPAKMLSYMQETQNQLGPTIAMWVTFAVIWSSSGNTWSEKSGITPDLLTDVACLPVKLLDTTHLTSVPSPDQPQLHSIPNIPFVAAHAIQLNSPRAWWLLEMQNTGRLADAMCKVLCDQLSRLTENPLVGILLQHLLDSYCIFRDSSELLNKSLLSSTYFKDFIQKLPFLPGVEQILNGVIHACLRLLLSSAKSPQQSRLMATSPFIDVLQKFTSWKEPGIQFLSYTVLSQIACYGHIEPESLYCRVACWKSLPKLVVPLLKNYALYGEISVLNASTVFPYEILQYLIHMAWNDNNKVFISSVFSIFSLGDVIYVPFYHSNGLPLELKTVKYTILLSWLLAMNREYSERMSRDGLLMNALQSISEDTESEMKDDAYCALLEITGELHSQKMEMTGPVDVVIMSSSKGNILPSDLTSALEDKGYNTRSVCLSSSAPVIMETIHKSEFVIFLFDQAMTYSALCRTAMNYSRRIGKPSIGVFLSNIDKDSWEHTMWPQNKLLATSPTEIIPKILSVTVQQLARVQLPTPDRSVERAIVEKFQKFAADCRVGELFNEGNFFGSVFDSDGGYLKIPNKDVILTIPPGAVEDGKRQPVYCNVTAYKYGEIHPGKVILTPLVHCGPDGAKFKKDVLLSFPHSAVDEDSWNFTAMTKSGESKWEKLAVNDVLVKDGSVFLFLDHFTNYLAEADPKDSDVDKAQRRITIGAKGTFEGDEFFRVHVGAWYDTESASGGEEAKQGTDKWTEYKDYSVTIHDKILKIKINDVDGRKWRLLGSSKQKEISIGDIAQEGRVAHCKHTYEYQSPDSKPPRSFHCTVCVSLDVSDKETEIDLLERRKSTSASESASEQEATGDSIPELYRNWNEDWSPLDSNISSKRWRLLCEIMDVKRGNGTDWEGFGGEYGLNPPQLATIGGKSSPSNRLLCFFFNVEINKKNHSLKESLLKLENILKTIGNDQAAEVVRDEIEYREQLEEMQNGDNSSKQSPCQTSPSLEVSEFKEESEKRK